jgi:putative iron-dependent peroxidase
MATPQAGIFREGSAHHLFLEYRANPGQSAQHLTEVVAAVYGNASSNDASSVVMAFGPDLWSRLAPDAVPDGFRAFEAIEGGEGTECPSTQRDLLIWIQGDRTDDNLDSGLAIHRTLDGVARLELDEKGFVYHDSRDLTGFIDGTANPKGDDARAAALVPDGRPGEGGAFVLSQRWVHDLEAFLALPVAEQEQVIGRTKPDSIELTGDAMPPDSHVSRTDVSMDGVPMKIWRRSVPFGSVGEHGLYFLAFACELERFDVQLRRMFGVAEDGLRDRLTAFSTPVTSSYWFAPSEEALRALAGARR